MLFQLKILKDQNMKLIQFFDLAREKFKQIFEKDEIIEKYGISVRVLGDINMLPLDLQQMIARAVLKSKNNKRAILNVCLAYTSQNEIKHSIQELEDGVQRKFIHPQDITEDLFEQCLYSCSQPDVVVRTSGEYRLSDFLLWQSSFSVLGFYDVLWPEYTLWHLFHTFLLYQRNYETIKKYRTEYEIEKNNYQYQLDYEISINTGEPIEKITVDRLFRREQFLLYAEQKKLQELQKLAFTCTEKLE